MVDYQNMDLDSILHALANSTRRGIIMQLARKDLTVNELADKYDMSLQAVSKHIGVLVKSGLVVQEKEGRLRHCRANMEPLGRVSDLIKEYSRFWGERLDALDKYFEGKKKSKEGNSQGRK
jgi:DNA-binding transcriptional ArsR family regulator